MNRLVEYICDELEELERKVGSGEKLSSKEIEYMDILAHAKKNILKSEMMMDGNSEYSGDGNYYNGGSNRRSRSSNRHSMSDGNSARSYENRDSMGRYASGARSRSGHMPQASYANGMDDIVQRIYGVMDELPANLQQDAQRLAKEIEMMM